MTPEQTLDWLAQQHWDQCREDRPIQDWIRKMKSMLPEQAQKQEPVTDEENEKFSRDVSNFQGSDPEATKFALEQFLKNRTSPQRQLWVSLSDDQKRDCADFDCRHKCVAATESKLRKLNEAPQRHLLTNKYLQRAIYEHTKLNPNRRDDQELIGYIINAIDAVLSETLSLAPTPQRQPLTDEQEREAFEDYAVRTICNPVELQRKRLSGYGSEELNYLWRGWKARAAHGIKGEAC